MPTIVGARRRLRRVAYSTFAASLLRREMAVVEAAYQSLLCRPLDATGEQTWRRRIARGEVSGADAAAELISSPEYVLTRTGFYERLHAARMEWVSSLDRFETILDIGGSSPTFAEGALIELGYSHRPSELVIFDRPVDAQFHGRPNYDQSQAKTFEWGTISFIHGRAEELADVGELANRGFDCIFMGQTIEHVELDRLPDVLAYIREHLATGGRFVFDTPNRDLTRLVVGDAFLTDDHTHEFTPAEMEGLLQDHGLVVTRRAGLLPMPRSAASGTFDHTEAQTGDSIVDDPVDSFVFAFECAPTG